MTDTTAGTELTATVTIDANPAQVWALITDLPRMASWSPQVVRSFVLGGGPVREGTRFLNLNHQGWKHWPTTGRVVRFRPHEDFAFRITENRTIWSFQLEPVGDGPQTMVTHRRETPEGISALSTSLTKLAFGGQEPFTTELVEGMHQTLGRLKADAER